MSSFRGVFQPTEGAKRARVHAIDAVRGLAVVAMIVWHTADGWLLDTLRDGAGFPVTRMIGGLAAPGFLLLAGLSLSLAAPERPDLTWVIASSRRAARIVLGGYALNLWAWAVDRGAVLERVNRPVAAAAAVALALAAVALRDRETPRMARAALGLGALVALSVVASRIGSTTRIGASLLPRLDVLHGIGAALVLTALALWALRSLPERARTIALASLAIVISTSSVASIGVPQRVLPIGIADWIARGAPWPAPTTSAFPLFPWLAYALLGAAIARWMRGASIDHRWALPRVARPLVLAAVAVAIAVVTWEPMPTARAVLDHAGWLRSLFRLAYNTSVIAAAGALVASVRTARAPLRELLALLGRSSLLAYCVHLEFAFGLAGVPVRHAVDWAGWALGATLLVAAMIGVAAVAERLERRARKRSKQAVHATT